MFLRFQCQQAYCAPIMWRGLGLARAIAMRLIGVPAMIEMQIQRPLAEIELRFDHAPGCVVLERSYVAAETLGDNHV